MSASLTGSKTGPCGVWQRTNTGNKAQGGHTMNIEMILLIVILTFGFAFVLDRWGARGRRD
jgi:hypothetical protein